MAIIISKNGKDAKKIEKSEFEKENYLQEYIHDNPELIPLYDIKEDIRLLVLAREFPTESGSIDALGIDKNGDIYLIETKLYKNPDKRMVVAQMLDYGASLWRHHNNFEQFIGELDNEIKNKFKIPLTDKVKEFFELNDEELSTLLENIKENLNDGNFKFVVLMDKLSDRLKDLIMFINENSKFDIFAVELEYYKMEEGEILIPKIFGAEVKKDIVSAGAGSRKKWNESAFFEEAEKSFGGKELEAIKRVYEFSKSNADEIRWGTGVMRGSFGPIFLKISNRSIYMVNTDGELTIHFQWLPKEFNNKLKIILEENSFIIPADYQDRHIHYPIKSWFLKADNFISVIKKSIKE